MTGERFGWSESDELGRLKELLTPGMGLGVVAGRELRLVHVTQREVKGWTFELAAMAHHASMGRVVALMSGDEVLGMAGVGVSLRDPRFAYLPIKYVPEERRGQGWSVPMMDGLRRVLEELGFRGDEGAIPHAYQLGDDGKVEIDGVDYHCSKAEMGGMKSLVTALRQEGPVWVDPRRANYGILDVTDGTVQIYCIRPYSAEAVVTGWRRIESVDEMTELVREVVENG